MSALRKARVGIRLRRFREELGLTQAALADALGISPSYVNQMESNQRPITAPVLLKLASVYGVDVQVFSTEESDRLLAQLRDVFADPSIGESVSGAEMRELAQAMPTVSRFLIELHRRQQHAAELASSVAARIDAGARGASPAPSPTAYEEVRDLFYRHRNHFDDLDRMAEELRASLGEADLVVALCDRLEQRHATRVVDLAPSETGLQRRYDPARKVLELAADLSWGQRAFRLATHLALVEAEDLIEQVVASAGLSGETPQELARLGLAGYVAGAVVLPYGPFLAAAEQLRYDVELLAQRFRVGYETIAHRLSTLQRRGASGVPFLFVRVDRAGNISKRQSATDFHFSRVGGTCPLWNVYEAFSRPGQICTQLAQMPDGRTYLWVARTVSGRSGGYGTPGKTFAIAIGCDLHHAQRLVYADGLDVANPDARTPIGPGCKVCDRPACPQRAFPSLGASLRADRFESSTTPYRAAR